MLQIAALFVAGSAALDDQGAIYATRIATTWFRVDKIPLMARVPVVLVVHARAGGDYDPELHVVCKDPAGVPRGTLEGSWHWPDDVARPSKYRCFTQDLVFRVETEGEYTIGAVTARYYVSLGSYNNVPQPGGGTATAKQWLHVPALGFAVSPNISLLGELVFWQHDTPVSSTLYDRSFNLTLYVHL